MNTKYLSGTIAAILITAALPLLVSACGSSGSKNGPENTCTKGEELCGCAAGDTCNTGLVCKDGFCVPGGDCPAGTIGCPCKKDGVCGTYEGNDLVCQNNVCAIKDGPAPGTLGGPCGPTVQCQMHEGVQLVCVEHICQLPDCPVGTLDCPCGTGGQCESGLTCIEEKCRQDTRTGVIVGSAAVRACDIVFDAGAKDIATMSFAAAVKGKFLKKGTKIAFSFAALQDAALSLPVASAAGGGGAAASLEGITPQSVKCYDRLGAPVTAPGVEFK